MAEKPMLFNTDMVKAILENRKTQTRRIIKPQPKFEAEVDKKIPYKIINNKMNEIQSPYAVGDILWVRETWCKLGEYDDGVKPETVKYYYYASYEELPEGDFYYENEETPRSYPKWKPSIHMPRSAARLFLKVTDVRVERLQDITDEGAKLEGFEDGACLEARELFLSCWDEIYKNQNENPWVWVIEFERVR